MVNGRENIMAHKGNQGKGDESLQTNSEELGKICLCVQLPHLSLKQSFDEHTLLYKKCSKTRTQTVIHKYATRED